MPKSGRSACGRYGVASRSAARSANDGLVRGVSRLAVVQPVIGFGHANRVVADSHKRGCRSYSPTACQRPFRKNTPPQALASRHQCVVAAEQSHRVGALEQIDLGHHEIGQRISFGVLVVPDEAAQRAFAAAERDVASQDGQSWCFAVMLVSVEIDVLFQRSVHHVAVPKSRPRNRS